GEASAAESKAGKRREVVWIEDGLPAGGQAAVDGSLHLPWKVVGKAEHPPASGEGSLKLAATGLQQLVVQNASPGLRVGEGDRLFAHVFIDTKDPPSEIMLQWHTVGWMHRAYWGLNRVDWGRARTPKGPPQGALREAGK